MAAHSTMLSTLPYKNYQWEEERCGIQSKSFTRVTEAILCSFQLEAFVSFVKIEKRKPTLA
jgi:hypothetical protein